MSIVKCPKCGGKYDSLYYDLHSCKKNKEKKEGSAIRDTVKLLDESSYTPYRGMTIKSNSWKNLGLPLITVGLLLGLWFPPAILIFGLTAILFGIIGMFRQK